MATLEEFQALVHRATHFSSHSGEVGERGIFVALRGEASDGHTFVADVLRKPVHAVVVERSVPQDDARVIVVPSTQAAHWMLASLFRKKFTKPVIGIGGSNGKTTTKDFLFQILSKKFNCVRTDKSQNGQLGIPKTLEKLRPDVDIAIIEIGTDAPGDMRANVDLADPSHGILTSIGEEHLNLLGDLEGVFREERTLADYVLARKGKFFCPKADPYLQRLKAEGAQLTPSQPSEINSSYHAALPSAHARQNLALAVSMALELGVTHAMIVDALNEIALPDGRGGEWNVRADLVVLRDHYNANPSSMRAALQSAAAFARDRQLPLKLILGDMLDLGSKSFDLHRAVLREACAFSPQAIVCIGPQFLAAAPECTARNAVFLNDSRAELGEELKKEFSEPAVVLVKGSRGTQVEHVMDRLFGKKLSVARIPRE